MKKVFLSWVFIIPLLAFGQEADKDLSYKLDSLTMLVNENILTIDTTEVTSFCKKINDRVVSMEGENSINMSLACRCFGYASILRKDFKRGEKWFIKAIEISKKYEEESELYWTLMGDLAKIKDAIGETDKALEIYNKKAGFYEKKPGDYSFEFLKAKLAISQILKRLSRIQEAEQLLFDIEEKITERNEEQQRLKVEWLNAIADIFDNKGNYNEAGLYYSRAVDIFEKNRFSVSKLYFEIGYAEALKYKGYIFVRIGKHKEAEELVSRAIDIMMRLLPNNHERVLRAKFQMGLVNYGIRNLNKSEKIFLELLPQIEGSIGQENDLYSRCLHMLGSSTFELGKYDDAEKYYMKSYEVQKKLYGEENLQLWITIYTISYIYMQKKEFDTAEKWLFKAKKLVEDQAGKESGSYAQCLAGLGDFYIRTKNYEKAYQVTSEALILKEKTHGKRSLRYMTGQFVTGWAAFLTGEIEKSSKHFLIGDSLHQSHMKNSIYFMTETEKANFLKNNKPAKDGLFSILYHEADSDQKNEIILKAAYNYNLFYNGFLADAVIRLNKLVVDHPDLKSDYDSLKMHKRLLIKEQSKVPGTSNPEIISNTKDKIFEIEKRLTLSVSKFGELIRDIDIEAVQKRLRPNECAIEFVDFIYIQEDSLNNINTYCIALILHPDNDIPKFIPLFEQRSLDSLLQIHEERRSGYVNDLYSYSERGAVAIGKPKKSLYELIWQPLEKELEGKKTIFYSPAGLLHRINLNAIPFDDETTLGDKIKLVRVNSTRQLAIPQTLEKSTKDAVLFGGIQYEIDSAAIVVANKEILYNSVASRNLGEMKFETSDSTSRGEVWNYLKWTKKEVETIADILESTDYKTTTRTDFLATEEAFRAIGQRSLSPRILHVATHGFFFPDPNTSNNKEDGNQSAFKTNRHPMIRSGLIMAGGNHAWQNKPALKGMEDGILTAYEISQMNLTNTELVVLSACETGLGDIQGNEGVYGLQRAFKIAGAKYLIMSLWQVPDRETKDFMVAFYQHWLEDEMTIPDAFRQTQEDMKKRFYNPYQWAGFILVE